MCHRFDDLHHDEILVVDTTASGAPVFLDGQMVCSFSVGTPDLPDAAESVICGFDPVIIGDLTPGAWEKVRAARRLLGRPLDHNEVLEIVEAEEGADAHA